jgi:FkbM family methyltransferase
MLRRFAGQALKPEYVLRPSQVVRRLRAPSGGEALVRLPWGHDLLVNASEHVGNGISRTGVHELPVTELVHRLLDPGDVAVDVGANIGYFTSLMASRVGRAGRVIAFEPFPAVLPRLRSNIARNRLEVELLETALGGADGDAMMSAGEDFSANEGTASLASSGVPVAMTTLDRALEGTTGKLLKVDVEGAEMAVLEGAHRTLDGQRVAHWIYEDLADQPSEVGERFMAAGAELFGVAVSLAGPRLVPVSASSATGRWDAPTFVATFQADDLRRRMAPRGWKALRAQP